MSLCDNCVHRGYIEDDKGNKYTWCEAKALMSDFSDNIIKCSEHRTVKH